MISNARLMSLFRSASFGTSAGYGSQAHYAPSRPSILPLVFGTSQASSATNRNQGDMSSMMQLMMMMKGLMGRRQHRRLPRPEIQPPVVAPSVSAAAPPAPEPVNPQIRPQTPDGPNLGAYTNTARLWFNYYNAGRPELSLETFAAASARDGGGWAVGGNVGLFFKDADRDANGTLTLHEFAKSLERSDMNNDLRSDTADAMGYSEKLRADGTAKLLGVA